MPQYEKRDNDGKLVETITVTEEVLKQDPYAVVKFRSGEKDAQPPTAPEGYDYIARMDGDPDVPVSGVSVFIFAKKDAYTRERPAVMGVKPAASGTKPETPVEAK